MKKIISLIFIAGIIFTLCACTHDEPYIPSLEKYTEDTNLIINVCNKLSEEHDPVKLRKVILAMQASRTIICTEYNGECALYQEFEQIALNATENGGYEPGAQQKLKAKITELTQTVENGKLKLKALQKN